MWCGRVQPPVARTVGSDDTAQGIDILGRGDVGQLPKCCVELAQRLGRPGGRSHRLLAAGGRRTSVRTWRWTLQLAGIISSCSDVSSPICSNCRAIVGADLVVLGQVVNDLSRGELRRQRPVGHVRVRVCGLMLTSSAAAASISSASVEQPQFGRETCSLVPEKVLRCKVRMISFDLSDLSAQA